AVATANVGADTPFTLLRNKIDLARPDADRVAPAQSVDDRSAMRGTDIAVLAISALTGEGLDALIAHLHSLAGYDARAPGTFSARRRHLAALERARSRLVAARNELDTALELAAEELRGAQSALGELTGELTSDDLLGEIFATFCIGK